MSTQTIADVLPADTFKLTWFLGAWNEKSQTYFHGVAGAGPGYVPPDPAKRKHTKETAPIPKVLDVTFTFSYAEKGVFENFLAFLTSQPKDPKVEVLKPHIPRIEQERGGILPEFQAQYDEAVAARQEKVDQIDKLLDQICELGATGVSYVRMPELEEKDEWYEVHQIEEDGYITVSCQEGTWIYDQLMELGLLRKFYSDRWFEVGVY